MLNTSLESACSSSKTAGQQHRKGQAARRDRDAHARKQRGEDEASTDGRHRGARAVRRLGAPQHEQHSKDSPAHERTSYLAPVRALLAKMVP